jgi:HAE1 family hydrophobic/amphiphilic exporter-1
VIVAASFVPLKMTKTNMFGGDDVGEIDIYYQWKGAYTKEQMSAEILKVEHYLDAHRKEFDIDQVFSRYREQGWAGTNVKLATKDREAVAKITEAMRKDMPKSARANIGIGDQGGPGGDQQGKEIQVMLVGDSTQTLNEIADDIVPLLARHKELRDVRVDSGDRNSELTVEVDRDRAAAFGFSANDVATFVGLALRGAPLREFRRGDTEVPVWVRFAGADNYGTQDLASFTVRAPDGRSVPLLAMVNVHVTPALRRSNAPTARRR